MSIGEGWGNVMIADKDKNAIVLFKDSRKRRRKLLLIVFVPRTNVVGRQSYVGKGRAHTQKRNKS
jgi:hypothetical protein